MTSIMMNLILLAKPIGSFAIRQSSTFGLPEKYYQMTNILYIIAVVLIIGWAIGYFAYNAGSLIHILLVIAVIAILLQIISGRQSL